MANSAEALKEGPPAVRHREGMVMVGKDLGFRRQNLVNMMRLSIDLVVSIVMGVSQNGWCLKKSHEHLDDLEVSLF